MYTVSRHVRSDSTVKIETLAYEVPHKFIGEHVKIKYYPDDQKRVFISYQDELIECQLLNKEDNSKVKRHIDYSKVGDFNV